MHNRIVSAVLFVCLSTFLLGQGTDPQVNTTSSPSYELQLGVGDMIEVLVFDIPELTQTMRIHSDGSIACALVGQMQAAGISPETLAATIGSKLKDGHFVANPHVTVTVKDFATQGVSVFGEVRRPGVYKELGPRKLLDILAEAGGLESTAGTEVKVGRRNGGPETAISIDSRDAGNSLRSNVPIFPGDTIVVPRAQIVYVLGDVGKAGGFQMENNGRMSVLQAIALAQGLNRTAAVGKAKIIRRTASGLEEHPVELSRILKGQAQDQWLERDDVLYVPGSFAKSAGRRTMEAIIQTATGMSVYSYRH